MPHPSPPTIDNFKIFTLNINYLPANIPIINIHALTFNPDIICLTKIWLTPSLNSNQFNILGYNLVRNDRGLVHNHNHNNLPVRGGGVAAYIKNSYNFRILELSTNTYINETEFILEVLTNS